MQVTVELHPLEPLTADEVMAAVEIVRRERGLSEFVRFVSVTLHEPSPEVMLAFQPGEAIAREAFMVLLDKTGGVGATYEAIVNITKGTVASWRHVEGAQPSIMPEEYFLCEKITKAHPDFHVALARRGITDLDLVYIDAWSAGNFGNEEESTQRILRTTVHVRLDPTDPNENSYAHPVAGLHPLFDLNKMEVIRIEDYGVAPVPRLPGNYTAETVGPLRDRLKPLDILQLEGPSFRVNGHHVEWDNWSFRVGFSPRVGLILYEVGFKDQGRVRSILRRAALSEMVVPYGDPGPSHGRQNAFDVGEYGVGVLANALKLGCDCLGTIHYFDAHMTANDGSLLTLPNVVCMHEEDDGILWKHTIVRIGHVEVRRSRRLVVSFIATVGNYEYGFFWYFRQDGSMEMDVKLTGILNVGALQPGVVAAYGKLLTPELYAPNHQHFFCFRLDPMVDGVNNSVVEEHTESVEVETPFGNAFAVRNKVLRTESEAQQVTDQKSARTWKIINPGVLNPVNDEPVGYQLMPGGNVLPFATPTSSFMQRAGFAKQHLWVTPYTPEEQYAAGDYPNQHAGGAGLPEWTRANRTVENSRIVVWYNVGVHHAPRIEDWPVMPVAHAGFMLRPNGFFTRNPAIDLPSADAEHGLSCEC